MVDTARSASATACATTRCWRRWRSRPNDCCSRPTGASAADEVLERLGIAAGVSRAYVIENHPDEQGRLLGTHARTSGAQPGSSSQAPTPSCRLRPGTTRSAVGGDPCARGAHHQPTSRTSPPEERPEFEQQGILSLAEHPVFVGTSGGA